jgi:hypothetical protein
LTNGNPGSWGFSLFCDDIRAEIGAKISVMGIYQNDMVFPTSPPFPFVIPKFCILVKYFENLNAFTEDIAIRIFFPGDLKDTPSVVLPIQRATIEPPGKTLYPLEEDQERVLNITVPVTLAPFSIRQAGFIKVRALCGDRTTNLGSLMIRTAEPNEILPWVPPQPPESPPS